MAGVGNYMTAMWSVITDSSSPTYWKNVSSVMKCNEWKLIFPEVYFHNAVGTR